MWDVTGPSQKGEEDGGRNLLTERQKEKDRDTESHGGRREEKWGVILGPHRNHRVSQCCKNFSTNTYLQMYVLEIVR